MLYSIHHMATAAGCTAPNERHAHTTGKINLCCQFAHIIIFTQLFFIFLFPPGTVVSFYAIFFSCISLCITNKLSSAPLDSVSLERPQDSLHAFDTSLRQPSHTSTRHRVVHSGSSSDALLLRHQSIESSSQMHQY